MDWDDPQAKDGSQPWSAARNALVAVLAERELGERAASAVGLLALVAGRDGVTLR